MRSHRWTVGLLTVLALAASPWTTAEAQRRYRVPSGTTINVRLDTKISTEHANRGASWSGTTTSDVYTHDGLAIPAGTQVRGVVTSSAQGTHSTRPQIGLAIRRVYMNGRSYAVDGYTPPIVAGSKRAKKIGAIAGGALVGGLLGRAVGGGKGTVIGGILGGAGAYAATRNAFRTLILDPGTELSFTTQGDLYARR